GPGAAEPEPEPACAGRLGRRAARPVPAGLRLRLQELRGAGDRRAGRICGPGPAPGLRRPVLGDRADGAPVPAPAGAVAAAANPLQSLPADADAAAVWLLNCCAASRPWTTPSAGWCCSRCCTCSCGW